MVNEEVCDEYLTHPDRLSKVKQNIPPEEQLYDLAELYKLFADSTRVKILYALWVDELCVCDIAQTVPASQSAVSHQLRILKNGKLVKSRRDGKTVFYSLADDHVRSILELGMEHLTENEMLNL